MAKNKSSNAAQKANYKKYKSEDKHRKNKLVKLASYVLKTPKDEQANKALDNLIENGVPYTRNRKSIKPNSTVQRRVRKSEGFSPNRNTFYAEIVPQPSSSIKKKEKYCIS